MGRGEACGKCLYLPLNFAVYLKTFILLKEFLYQKTKQNKTKPTLAGIFLIYVWSRIHGLILYAPLWVRVLSPCISD